MTQSNPDQQEPEWREQLASAVRLLAHAIIFLAGAVMFGWAGTQRDHDFVPLVMIVGAIVMLVSGIMFFLAD